MHADQNTHTAPKNASPKNEKKKGKKQDRTYLVRYIRISTKVFLWTQNDFSGASSQINLTRVERKRLLYH